MHPHLTEVNRLASNHVLPVFSHLQEALHSLTPTLSYRLRHWDISHTGVFCTFFTVTANSLSHALVRKWKWDRVCFNYSEQISLTNGCLTASLLVILCSLHSLWFSERGSQHTCRSFGVKRSAQVWKPFKIRPNQFWLLQKKKKNHRQRSHRAKTSRADNSKRSIFKPGVVCWFVGGGITGFT